MCVCVCVCLCVSVCQCFGVAVCVRVLYLGSVACELPFRALPANFSHSLRRDIAYNLLRRSTFTFLSAGMKLLKANGFHAEFSAVRTPFLRTHAIHCSSFKCGARKVPTSYAAISSGDSESCYFIRRFGIA